MATRSSKRAAVIAAETAEEIREAMALNALRRPSGHLGGMPVGLREGGLGGHRAGPVIMKAGIIAAQSIGEI
jgi:hypothetical protein